MIVVTGAYGFIGSALVHFLNTQGHSNILAVDAFHPAKEKNLFGKSCAFIDREAFLSSIFMEKADQIQGIFHLGARTDTTEKDWQIFQELNLDYSKHIWEICAQHQIPLVYASSAATYGLGEWGYQDDHSLVDQLQPLNPYGRSKQVFDQWVLQQTEHPPFWAGLKFFNVYGPNEYHKGRMASVVWHAFRQIKNTGEMKLFRSHKEGIADGQQSRDFIFVEDVLKVCNWLMQHQPKSGLYNVGTGKARSFYDLVAQTFRSMGLKPQISFIDTPADIRDTYQYFTEADLSKLRQAGYSDAFLSLEEGVDRYVRQYLNLPEGPKIT
ncbi:MAG: ADP-glyceromanno-heptose 6-epimerase [Bacteroidota bacterium]